MDSERDFLLATLLLLASFTDFVCKVHESMDALWPLAAGCAHTQIYVVHSYALLCETDQKRHKNVINCSLSAVVSGNVIWIRTFFVFTCV